ncbi:MAG: replicative DNA helicase [Elusimicrobiota bacterium]|jgi:replicative DNA helicase
MPTDTLQLPPQALDAEMAVLGSMLIEKDAVEKGMEILRPGDFYKDSHKKIFEVVAALHERGQVVDLITVSEELRAQKMLQEAGGVNFLNELTHKVSSAAHVEHYAHLVRDKSLLRSLIRSSTELIARAYSEEKETSELLDEAERQIYQIAQQQASVGFTDPKALVHEVIEQIERLAQRKEEVTGVPTGLTKLDQMTSGLQKGDLILIAARPSQGKTALALNIAANVVLNAKKARPVAFFSLEMSKHAIMTRLIASEARVDVFKVRGGFFPRDRWTDLTNAAARLSEAPLYIDDSNASTVLQVRTRARRLASELHSKGKELGMVMIDYLQLMHGSSRRTENRQQEVSEISRGLKQLARDLNVPVVALSQLSRRTEEKGRVDARPQLSDLRESGALEQDADVVGMIYREGYYKRDDPTLEHKAELIIAKQRNGPVGKVPLVFRSELARFENFVEDAAGAEEPAEEQATFE